MQATCPRGSIDRGSLPPTLSQRLITLIPKSKKVSSLLDNGRPVSLLNNDYKILALTMANRLKPILDSITDESQSGFMRTRHISNNVRLVLDILDYSELMEEDSLILFLDFYKAFDSLEHDFMMSVLNRFGNICEGKREKQQEEPSEEEEKKNSEQERAKLYNNSFLCTDFSICFPQTFLAIKKKYFNNTKRKFCLFYSVMLPNESDKGQVLAPW